MSRMLCAAALCALVAAVASDLSAVELDRSPMQLAASADGKWLYTANRTAHSVSKIDVASRKLVGEFSVGAGPTGIALSPDGTKIYTANRLADSLSVVHAATGKTMKSISLANQPCDVVVADNGTIYVSCLGKDDVVQVIDSKTLTVRQSISVDPNPRHLELSADGKTLLVTCDAYDTTRWLDVIDLATGRATQRVEMTMVSNLRGVAQVRPKVVMVAHLNPNPFAPLTQVQQGWVNTNGISFVFFDGQKPRSVMLLLDEFTQYFANPYDVVVTPDGRFAYVSCGGAEQVVVVDLNKALGLINNTPVAKRGRLRSQLSLSPQFVAARIPVGWNPYGLAMSSDGKNVFVANHLGNSVSIIDTSTNRVAATIDVGSAPTMTPTRRGEILFNTASICFQRQFSCASCHPEGHTTGLSWDLEDDGLGNPKNVRSFRGVKETAPFRWQGEALTIDADECGPTVTGAMRGQSLRESDLAALTVFVANMPLMPNPYRDAAGKISAAAQRGKAIFDGEARCAKCHTPGTFTNGKRRTVGTGEGRPDRIKLRDGSTVYPTSFDVPHLVGAWDSAPYLHDGRAKTLLEIFTKHDPDDKHGKTSELSEEQLRDLVEYLKTL